MTVKVLLTAKNSETKDDTLLQEIAFKLAKARKLIAVTGAGVSCNAGIPDFRSEDGLYNMVKKQYPNVVVKGKDLFDAVLFSSPDTIQVFFTFMAHLRECILKARSTQTHKLLKLLKEKKKLLRCYTQNIDGLETYENLCTGITPQNWKKLDVIQLHGDIHKLKCMHCSELFDWTEDSTQICKNGEAPECPACRIVQEDRMLRGRRNTGVGRLKPNIVLYGEEHPDGDLIGRCTQADFKSKPDFLLIAGTSLKVIGIQKLVRQAAKSVKAKGGVVIFVNKTEVGTNSWKDVIDYHIEADCDEWVANLKTRIPDFFAIQTSIKTFALPASSKKKPTAAQRSVPTLETPPATPVKTRKRPVAPVHDDENTPVVIVDDSDREGEGMLSTPPRFSTPRKSRRLTASLKKASAVEMGLLTPEKTPSRKRNPLQLWEPNAANTRKRSASTLAAEFEPIKRTRR
ncbi:hypothetical protein D0Z00_003266 [Geotrichum galactomycetum]|uniref:Uncharacterized protein n=1 Tax=Geotrichum galactomycetum TaxID=27317 RepID=A0ACB6V215_9ASCO|nr:hypothetical protein D0Z00_003266 [Geotrichum candidum]